MAQDRINEKPTEVEEFSGTVIRLAQRHGLLVPTNRWLYERIRGARGRLRKCVNWGQSPIHRNV